MVINSGQELFEIMNVSYECTCIEARNVRYNTTYRQMADSDTLKASNDLRLLKAYNLLNSKGKGKATYYVAGNDLSAPAQDLSTPVVEISTPPQGLIAPPRDLSTPPKEILERIKPIYHIFGHIHENYDTT